MDFLNKYFRKGENNLDFENCFILESPELIDKRSDDYKINPDFKQILSAIHSRDSKGTYSQFNILKSKYQDLDLVYFWMANFHSINKEYSKSESILKEGILKCRKKQSLYSYLGTIHFRKGDLPKAICWWIKSIYCQHSINYYNDDMSFLYIGYVAKFLKENKISEEFLKKHREINNFPGGLQLNADEQNTLLKMIYSSNQEKLKEAIKKIFKIIDSTQTQQQTFDSDTSLSINKIPQTMIKGIELGKNGKNEEALLLFNQILRVDPNNAQAHYNKGVAFSALGKNNDALESFENALKIKPDYADSWYNKGVTLKNLGKLVDSQYCFDKVAELENKSKNIEGILDKNTKLNNGKSNKIKESIFNDDEFYNAIQNETNISILCERLNISKEKYAFIQKKYNFAIDQTRTTRDLINKLAPTIKEKQAFFHGYFCTVFLDYLRKNFTGDENKKYLDVFFDTGATLFGLDQNNLQAELIVAISMRRNSTNTADFFKKYHEINTHDEQDRECFTYGVIMATRVIRSFHLIDDL